MELITLHRRAVEQWAASVAAVKNDQWVDPTPCTEWSVRELVNHVVAEELWMAPLLRGATIQEVGHQFDGDVLGGDPLGRARMGADEAVSIVDAIVPEGGRVQLSYGEEDMGEYVRQLCADHLIHCWDLAAATGGDTSWTPSSLPRLAPGSSNERRCTAAPVPLVHALPVRVTRSRTFLRPSAGPRNGVQTMRCWPVFRRLLAPVTSTGSWRG